MPVSFSLSTVLGAVMMILKFWTQFSETQAFEKFIEDLTYESTEDPAVTLRSFYKCCQYVQYEHKEGDYDDPVYNTSNVVKARKKLSIWASMAVPNWVHNIVYFPLLCGCKTAYQISNRIKFHKQIVSRDP
eukprot:720614_1